MRFHFRFLAYLLVFIGVNPAVAGSYEDFFSAIKRDDPRTIVQLLERGFDPNTPGPDGAHGLITAVREPAFRSAEALAAWPKTNVEPRTAQDESPLMLAALKGHMPLVRKLIDRGADVNKPGWTPLHYAATHGHLAIMELLLEHHAFINATSPNGTTPLMMAAHYGTPAAVKLLLEQGAEPGLRNELGLTAIDFAQRGNRKESAELIAEWVRRSRPRGRW
jgi:ankyrin repeat protein